MVSLVKRLAVVKWRPLVVIFAVIAVVSWVNPFGLAGAQHGVFGALLFAVGAWATGALDRSVTSVLLVVAFLVFGETPVLSIVGFAWSDVILLIATSSLLSVALGKNAWLRRGLNFFVRKTTGRAWVFYLSPFVLAAVLIFVIPQTFARVVLLAGLYESLMKAEEELGAPGEPRGQRQAVFFQIYLAVTVTSMLFANGDIVLNHAALTLAGPEVSAELMGFRWFEMMGVPTIVLAGLMLVLMRVLLRGRLPERPADLFVVDGVEAEAGAGAGAAGASVEPEERGGLSLPSDGKAGLGGRDDSGSVGAGLDGRDDVVTSKPGGSSSQKDALGLVIMLVVVLFWATESVHGISGWIPALVGVVFLFLMARLGKTDLKAVNLPFLLFLIAVFNIGQVLRDSGVMEAIMVSLEGIIPDGGSAVFLPALILVTMLLHMFLGSAVATLSFVIPILLPLAAVAGVPPEQMTLALYITVNIHFFLPFQHAVMLIGVGNGHVLDRDMLRYGTVMSVGLFLVLFGLYFPWWSLVG